jgi:hypothetical protein
MANMAKVQKGLLFNYLANVGVIWSVSLHFNADQAGAI